MENVDIHFYANKRLTMRSIFDYSFCVEVEVFDEEDIVIHLFSPLNNFKPGLVDAIWITL